MTAVHGLVTSHRPVTDRGSEGSPQATLGPLATWLGQIFVAGTLLQAFGVLPPAYGQTAGRILLAVGGTCILLTPRQLLTRLPVFLPMLAFIAWMAASVVWSVQPERTAQILQTLLPQLIGMIVISGLLATGPRLRALRASVVITLSLTVFALLTSSSARTTGIETDLPIAGWRGTFTDKNSLALYLVFALATTVCLDSRRSRRLIVPVILVLLLGSQSATGGLSALFVLVLASWLNQLHQRVGRQNAQFVLTSTGLAVIGLVGLLANASAVLDAYGKDVSLTGRTDIWVAVVKAVERRPLEGYGLGALFNPPSSLTLELWREIGHRAPHAHNGVLDIAGQLGLIGVGLYGIVVAVTLRVALRRLRADAAPAVFALTLIGGQLLMSISENVFMGPWLLVLAVVQAPFLVPRHVVRQPRDSLRPPDEATASRDSRSMSRTAGRSLTA